MTTPRGSLVKSLAAPMPETNQDFNERTLDLWQPRTSRNLTEEDAREMIANASVFFGLLAEWDHNACRKQEQPRTDEQGTDA